MFTRSRTALVGLILLSTVALPAEERLAGRGGHVWFFARSPLEVLEVHCREARSHLDPRTGEIEVAVPIRCFEFSTALMKRHFNESYLESDRFPEAVFRGKTQEPVGRFLTQGGPHRFLVAGQLTMHGVTRDLRVQGTLTPAADGMVATSEFQILPEDFRVEVPPVVRDETVKIHVELLLKPQ